MLLSSLLRLLLSFSLFRFLAFSFHLVWHLSDSSADFRLVQIFTKTTHPYPQLFLTVFATAKHVCFNLTKQKAENMRDLLAATTIRFMFCDTFIHTHR